MGNSQKRRGGGGGSAAAPAPLPIETAFSLPSPLPAWPQGDQSFGKGSIDLGGLEVCQIKTFSKVWAALEGGPDGGGATFFRPTSLPSGCSVLGCYAQPNGKPLFGWVLCGKDVVDVAGGGAAALQKPVDYTLVWSSAKLTVKRDGDGYFWLPVAPEGYRAVGLLVTSSPEKPSPEDIRCVRSDLSDSCENDGWVWGDGGGFSVYGTRPAVRGSRAVGVSVGSFAATTAAAAPALWCLKNRAPPAASMPDETQIESLMQAYSPWIYLHPKDSFLPSSVSWFFANGALLYRKGDPTPVAVDPAGSNLPQGGSSDGAFWIDLPGDAAAAERLKKGDLAGAVAYLHVKPMLGGTFTDMAVWVFYPFNGPARAKVEFVNIPFEKVGEHVGDWEHVTLRVSNFSGELWRVFFSAHSSGTWMDASQVEFHGGNKPVAYSSLHGHAAYSTAGLVLQGDARLGIGIRNDTANGGQRMDTGSRYQLVAADHLSTVAEPPWLNYFREWGPKVSYDISKELKKVERLLPGKLREKLESVLSRLPAEALGEEGPTGPKEKRSWLGDELGG